MKTTVEEMLKKTTPAKQNINLRPSSRQKDHNTVQKNTVYDHPQAPQTYFNEEWVLKIK